MRRRGFALAKETGQPSDDALAGNRAASCYAVCDGASACYAGRTWARILCRQYVRDPDVGTDWLHAARNTFRARATPPENDWLGRIAFERGSFSTLLGFTLHEDRVEGIALGDSVLFIQTNTKYVNIPTMTVADFAQNPILLSSHPERGLFPDTSDAFAAARFFFEAPLAGWIGTRFLAMTDALAAWVLAGEPDPAPRLGQLANLPDRAAFVSLVGAEISSRRMRPDDTTMLVIEL